MPQIGQDGIFQIDNASGALTNLSAECNQIDRSFDVALHDVTTFGDDWRNFIAGLRNATVTVNLFSNNTTDAHFFGILGRTVSVLIGPYGSTSGNTQLTFEALVQSWSGGTPVDGVDTGNVSLQVTGAVTSGTY